MVDLDYTTVVGVDKKHLGQLIIVWPTWKKYKSKTILEHPMVVFFDKTQVRSEEIFNSIDHPNLRVFGWPADEVVYGGSSDNKFADPQRYKMLAGFVYIPAMFIDTKYWLKLDTDTVATGEEDWIRADWFKDNPAIVSQRWTFTKPPDQMVVLDRWVKNNEDKLCPLSDKEPLNLIPRPGATRLGHRRIISWCSFFETEFTKSCAKFAEDTCGPFLLPVPSQDGYVWYVAKRLGLPIRTANMKSKGFKHRSTDYNIRKAVEEAMNVE